MILFPMLVQFESRNEYEALAELAGENCAGLLMTGNDVHFQFNAVHFHLVRTKGALVSANWNLIRVFSVDLPEVFVPILLARKSLFAAFLLAGNGIGRRGAFLVHNVDVPSQGFAVRKIPRAKVALNPLFEMFLLVVKLHESWLEENGLAFRELQASDELLRMRIEEMPMHQLVHRQIFLVGDRQRVHVTHRANHVVLFLRCSMLGGRVSW